MLAGMVNRQQQITTLLANKGRLSSSQVSDLQQTSETECRVISNLNDLWTYAIDKGLDSADLVTRQSAWRAYSTAAAILTYPARTGAIYPEHKAAVNPYQFYTKDIRDFIITQYRNATGDKTSSEQKIMDALIRNPQWKYEDALFGVYKNAAYKFAPTTADPVVNTLANLEAARVVWEYDYAQYKNVSEAAPARLEDGRYYVKKAVELMKASGARDDDVLIASANAWLALPTPANDAGKTALADVLERMAQGIVGVRIAEVRYQNSITLGRSDLTQEQLDKVNTIIAAARNRFEHLYNVPGFMPSYSYPDLPANVANEATRILAPQVSRSTEIHATYNVLQESENAKANVSLVTIGEGKGVEPAFADMRKAQLGDRDAAFAAAVTAARGNIMMLVSLKGKEFWTPDKTGSYEDLTTNFRQLSPDVQRREFNMVEVSRPTPTLSRADVHKAADYRFHEEAAVPQGMYHGEVTRQSRLNNDSKVPALLRQHVGRVSNFEDAERTIALSYGAKDATNVAQLTAINKGYMEILDLKITDLEARLNGSVEVTVEGKKQTVTVASLVYSKDPRHLLVVNAQKDLTEVKTLRQKYQQKIGTDLFDGSMAMNPKQSILTMEQALASLTDENLNMQPGVPPQIVGMVAGNDIRTIKETHAKGIELWAVPLNFGITDETGTHKYADYAKAHPDQLLRFNYFWYQELSGERQFLLNPNYLKHDAAGYNKDHRYIGVVMEDVVLTDGTKLKTPAVVRVEPTHLSPTQGPPFAPVLQKDSRVDPKDVLYHIKPGTETEPQIDSLLNANLNLVAMRRTATITEVSDNLAAVAKGAKGDVTKGDENLMKQNPAAASVRMYSRTSAKLLVTQY
jgi:hypothetical protein